MLEELGERGPLDQLEGQVDVSLVDTGVEHRDDVGMGQPRQHPRLLDEASGQLRIACGSPAQALEGHRLDDARQRAHAPAMGEEDVGHPAAADAAFDLVRPQVARLGEGAEARGQDDDALERGEPGHIAAERHHVDHLGGDQELVGAQGRREQHEREGAATLERARARGRQQPGRERDDGAREGEDGRRRPGGQHHETGLERADEEPPEVAAVERAQLHERDQEHTPGGVGGEETAMAPPSPDVPHLTGELGVPEDRDRDIEGDRDREQRSRPTERWREGEEHGGEPGAGAEQRGDRVGEVCPVGRHPPGEHGERDRHRQREGCRGQVTVGIGVGHAPTIVRSGRVRTTS
jgi:hypothetical protein